MKAINTVFMAVLLLASFVTSCTNDIEEAISQEKSYLKIDAVVNDMTRGAIDATNFTKDDAIGIFVRDLEGKNYSVATECSNIKAIYDGSKWTLTSQVVLLDGKEAVIYAYYPYNARAVTGDSIDIDITKQEDVMYGKATGVTAKSPTAKINFSHALARITLAITKGGNDIGEGELSSIKIGNIQKDPIKLLVGEAYVIATEGRMDIKTGEFYTNRTKEDKITLYKNISLSKDITKVDFLFVPFHKNTTRTVIAGQAHPYVNLYLTIDGQKYMQKITNPQWYAGQQYVYPININRTNKRATKVYMGFESDNGEPLYWASHNLGATSIEDYGGLYGWGDATGELTSTDINKYPGENPPESICGTEYDTARQLWGEGWRMPSTTEWKRLEQNCSCKLVKKGNTDGLEITSNINGNTIFLPYSPRRYGTELTWITNTSSSGRMTKWSSYWSGSKNKYNPETNADIFNIHFYTDSSLSPGFGVPDTGRARYYGLPIRPVTE